MTASKILKNNGSPIQQTLPEVIATTEERRKVLLGKLEIVKAKARLIQEQLDILEFGLGHYERPKTHS